MISRRGTDTGAYVQPPASSSTSASSPSPLFEVVRTDLMRIFVDVPESDAPFVRDGGTAQVRVQALRDREFSGRVARSSWLLDNQTRTLRTEIDLSNSEGYLRPGMYATARLIVEHPRALTVPSSAVFHQDDQDWVIQVVRGNAVRTPVKLGLRARDKVEVLRKQVFPVAGGEPTAWEDFAGRELIVRENPSTLSDGQQVQFLDDDSTVTAHGESHSVTTMSASMSGR